MHLLIHTLDQTLALGRLIGRLAPPPPATTCIALDGPLGAGKTHITRGIAQGAAITDDSLVSSPTYVLLNIYPGPKPVYHLDAYRIASEDDFAAVGFEELLSAGGIVVVEWASRIAPLLPPDRLELALEHTDDLDSHRTITLTATGPTSQLLLTQLQSAWPLT